MKKNEYTKLWRENLGKPINGQNRKNCEQKKNVKKEEPELERKNYICKLCGKIDCNINKNTCKFWRCYLDDIPIIKIKR